MQVAGPMSLPRRDIEGKKLKAGTKFDII